MPPLSAFCTEPFATAFRHPDSRYRARKLITFAGYLTGLSFMLLVFSNQLGHLTVTFGVAGAGIAFVLQEVIASIAGWVAIAIGHFYFIGSGCSWEASRGM